MKKIFTKTIVLVLFVLTGVNKSNSQNLVPNPGYEIITQCPPSIFNNPITYAPPWTGGNAGGATIYNLTCPPPLNEPTHSGNGCAGLALKISLPDQRQYVQAPLNSPLTAGQMYCVSFWLRLDSRSMWAVNTVGAYFSVGAVSGPGYNVLPYTPQYQSSPSVFFTDSLAYMQTGGSFTASGGETHVIIGNFLNEFQTGTQQMNGGINSSFYYIDDVSVTAVTTPCTVGLEENVINSNEIKIIPNPVSNFTSIVIPDLMEVTHVKLFDLTGKILEELLLNSVSKNEITLDVSKYSTGLYTLEITTNKGVVNNKIAVIK